jgi:hypothetical protein
MKHLPLLFCLLLAPAVHAYTGQEMLADCRLAEAQESETKSSDPQQKLRSGRCLSYIAGFADGYEISDYLAEKVGVRLNAFCLPNDPDILHRMVRAVVIHVERTPPQNTISTATLVAGALAKAFPCSDLLERKK